MEILIRGTGDFERAARRLRGAPKDIRKEAFKALNSTTKDSRAEVVGNLGNFLPDRYAAELAGDLSVRATANFARNPAVRIKTRGRKKKRQVGPLERGLLQHTLFGDRNHWYRQAVLPGFNSKPLMEDADETRQALIIALEKVAQKAAG